MSNRRAFTLIELVAILITGACAAPLAVVILGHQPDSAREAAQQKKDGAQVRAVHQGLVVWAGNHNDLFPLPSKLDTQDFTVADKGEAKDTTANIYSLMVYNGTISADLLVSPVEADPNIKVYAGYECDKPKKAATPAKAIWDPAFSVDFTGGNTGAASYAHLLPSGERLKRWSNTFKASELIVGMRGPEVSKVTQNEDGSVTPTLANTKSVTLGMYELSPSTWSGNVVYNDDSVVFLKRALVNGKKIAPGGKVATYKDAAGKSWPDLFNYDEPTDPAGVNDFLGIFTKAGAKPADFKAIWD